MQTALNCVSLDEVRQQIDRIDRDLIKLLAARGEYVARAAALKTAAAEVPATARVAEVIARIRMEAEACALSPAVAEATWRAMIGAFIEHEQSLHAALHPPSQTD
ncbi:MAG: chorismate mutase [Rhodocyclales bacterium GT-UBC]|nr:MAG: chorismate mutase [Rhodocyclales bacterium GT-UBC]